ncbi:MAG: tyrosine--tRNA ligase, partial [Thermoanaerobaculia bacterium]
LAGKWTLARMMERDDFRTRFREQQPISLHELLYPLVQAKDSVEMAKLPDLGCDVELGGHDQIFNLLVGRDLMKEEGLEPQVCLTVPLLVGLDGHEKMSKSLGNAIAVEDTPKEIYGKTLSIPDTLMWDWLLLLTDLSQAEIDRRKMDVAEGKLHPKLVKQELARRLVTDFHGATAAQEAEAEFERVFAGGGVPDDVAEFSFDTVSGLLSTAGSESSVKVGSTIVELLVATQAVASKNEARRMLEQGAVSVDGERVSDAYRALAPRDEAYLVKVGKRRFIKLRIA